MDLAEPLHDSEMLVGFSQKVGRLALGQSRAFRLTVPTKQPTLVTMIDDIPCEPPATCKSVGMASTVK